MLTKVFKDQAIRCLLYSSILLLFGLILPFNVYAFDLEVTKEDYSCGPDNNCLTTTDNSSGYVRKSEIINYDIAFQNLGTDDASGVYIIDTIPNGTCYKVNSIEANLPGGMTVLYSEDGVPTFPTGGSAIIPSGDSNGVDCDITAFKITKSTPLTPVGNGYTETNKSDYVGTKNNITATNDGKLKLEISPTFNQSQISTGNTGFTGPIEVINIDGDSDLDIVGAGVNLPTFLYKQTSPGVFSETQLSAGNTIFPGGATIIDVDANGKLDVVAGGDDFPTYIYFQQTNGTFTPTQISSGNTNFRGKVKVVDVDADGRLDVIGGGYNGNTTIFFRESNGSFTTLNLSSSSTTFKGGIEVEDLDGDGDIDIAGGGYFGRTYLFRKTGTRTFSETAISASNTNFESGLVVNDIDSDGDKDLIGGGLIGTSFAYIQNVSDNFIEGALPGGNTRFFSKPIIIDVDGDSDKDIIGGGYGAPTYLYTQTGAATFTQTQISETDTYFYSPLKTADMDGDGDTDIIGAGFNDHSFVYKNNNDGTFDENSITTVIANFIGNIEISDINGDSFLDVIGGADSGKSYLLMNSGNATFSQIELTTGNTYFKGGIKTTDIDGDGDTDIAGGGDGGPTYNFYNTSIYDTSGTYTTIIDPGSDVTGWTDIEFAETKPAGTTLTYSINNVNNSSCGTTNLKQTTASTAGVLDISDVSQTYDEICLIINFATTDTTKTPVIDSIDADFTLSETQTISYETLVDSDIKIQGIGSIINTVSVYPTSGDTNTSNNTDSSALIVVNESETDLIIEKSSTSCGPDGSCSSTADNDDYRVNENEVLRYSVSFKNIGKSASEKTEIIEEIPLKTCYVVASLENALPVDFPSYTISYSNDDKVTWTYTPSATTNGTDCNVTHLKLNIRELYRPSGNFTDWDRVADSMIGYWPLDEGISDIAYNVKDDAIGTISDYRIDGSVANSPVWQAPANCKVGGCLTFDGINDYITMSGTAISNSIIASNKATFSLWWKPADITQQSYLLSGMLAGNANKWWFIYYPANTTYNGFSVMLFSPNYVSSPSGTSWTAGTWYHLVGVYDGSTITLYRNGQYLSSGTSGAPSAIDELVIGSSHKAGNFANGVIDDVRIYNKDLSAAEVVALYENTNKSIFSATTINENRFTSDLKLHLKFDEGVGSSSVDASGNGNTATLLNSLGTSGWGAGKIKNALTFDNTDDKIEINDNDTLDATFKDSTWMYWVKVPANIAGGNGTEEFILSKYPTGTDEPRFSSAVNKTNGKLSFEIEGNSNGDQSSVISTKDLRDNTWHHIAFVRSTADQKLKIYIDGELDNNANDGKQNGSNSGKLTIGDYSRTPADGRTFSGSIDDIRYYERALDGNDISNIYRYGNTIEDGAISLDNEIFSSTFDDLTTKFGSGSSNISAANQRINQHNTNNPFSTPGEINFDGVDDYIFGPATNQTNSVDIDATISTKDVNIKPYKNIDISNGLVGYWRFEDNTGTSASDSSGNTLTGTLTNGPTWINGKFGPGINFDGANDYVNIPHNTLLNQTSMTASGWFYPRTAASGDKLFVRDDGSSNRFWQLQMTNTSGTLQFLGKAPALWDYNITSTSNLVLNQWNYVAVTVDASTDTAYLYINGNLAGTDTAPGDMSTGTRQLEIAGSAVASTNALDGWSDEIRFYNRALSSTEIVNLYNHTAPPVAHYSFDEGTGTSFAYDQSGKANHLTLSSMTSGSWVGGKLSGTGLNFNGTSQFAYISNPSSVLKPGNLTVSAWIKADTFTSSGNTRTYIVSEQPLGAWVLGRGYNLSADGGYVKFWIGNGSGSWITATGTTLLSPGVWYHLAGTYDGTALRVFVNGVQDGLTNTTATISYADTAGNGPNPQTFYIGTQHDTTNSSNITTANMYFFDGVIDEVKVYNYARTARQLQDDMSSFPVSLDSSAGGLVGHYKMDSDGNNSASASANGTVNGNLNFTSTGKVDNAGTFDGSGDFLDIVVPATQKTQVVTRSFWVNPANNFRAIYSYTSNSDSAGFDQTSGTHRRSQTYIDNNGYLQNILMTYTCSVGGGSFNEIVISRPSTKVIPLNKWTHITQVYDHGSSGIVSNKLYIDGVLDSESTVSGVCTGADTNYLRIGWKKFNASDFTGQIDDFRIYNRALTANEVKLLYQTESPNGTIASKGNNYELGITATQKNAAADFYANRASFTTNAITTQLSGTNINDVYFYDTTKDRNYGDGSAADPLVWRVNASRSWYTETIDATYAACNISTHDRCGTQAFPEKVYLVATDSNMYIFNAQENAMWMKFTGSSSTTLAYLNSSSRYTRTQFALNGKLYWGTAGYLGVTDFVSDDIYRHHNTTNTDFTGNISQRNGGSTGWAAETSKSMVLPSAAINSVHGAVVNGKSYAAVATDGGVTLINETDLSKIDFTRTGYTTGQGPVFLANDGTLYILALQSGTWDNLFVYYNANLITTNQDYVNAHTTSNSNPAIITPWIYGTHGTTKYNSLFVTSGTSTVDNKSNTIYLGTSDSGVTIINEKQGDETNGSSTFITKDFSTEEMIGDVRGNWPMAINGSNALFGTSTIATATLVGDISKSNRDLQTAGTVSVLSDGVRNQALTFNGSNNMLVQNPATQYDETNGNSSNVLRYDTNLQQLGQGFQVGTAMNVGAVQLYVRKDLSPSGNIWLEIQTNNAGVPSNTAVTNGVSSNISTSVISSAAGWITFRFPTSVSLAASTQYHLVLKGDYTLSTTNYITWYSDSTSSAYSLGAANQYNGTTWSAMNRDFIFKVFEDNTAFDFTTAYTSGAWIKTTVSTASTIFSQHNTNLSGAYKLSMNASGKAVGYLEVSPNTVTGTTSINDGNWHHVVHSYDGITSQIYVDGKLDGSQYMPGTIPNSNTVFMVGATNSAGILAERFNGSIDEVFLTAEVLSPDQIKTMYENGKRAIEVNGTNTFNGSSNAINSLSVSGLNRFTGIDGRDSIYPSRLFVGTQGGGVSEFDLGSDTLINFWTSGTTPAINHSNINSISPSSGGGFVAALDSGFSRLNDVSSRNELVTGVDTNVRGFFDKTDGYYKLYENGTEVGKTFVTTSHTPVADSSNTLLSIGAKRIGNYPYSFFYGKIKDINVLKASLSGTFERIITTSDSTFSNWSDLVLQQSKPNGTDITYTIYPYTSSCDHGTILYGPASISGSEDISAISPTYNNVCILATLTTNNHRNSPTIDFMSANYNSTKYTTFDFNVRTDASRDAEIKIINTIEIDGKTVDPYSENNTYTDEIGFNIPSVDLDIDKDGYSCGTDDNCTLDTGLVSKWKLNDDAIDAISTNNGSTKGTTRYVIGMKDNALLFDTSDDYVEIPDSTNLNFNNSTDFTIAGWVYLNNTGQLHTIYDKRDNTSGLLFGVKNDNKMHLYLRDTSLVAVEPLSNTALRAGKWYHIAVTADRDGNASFYLDGIYDGGGAISSVASINNTAKAAIGNKSPSIGASSWTNTNGRIDDLAIYNRLLSASEVKKLAGNVTQAEYIQYTLDYSNRSSELAKGYEIVDKIPAGTCYKVDSIETTLPVGAQVYYSTDDIPTFSTISPYSPQPNGDGVDCNITAFKIIPESYNKGLVSYWNMNETTWTNNCSSGTVKDSIGTSNALSCPNSTGPTGGATGKFAKGGDFDGSDDYLTADASSITSKMTMAGWFNVDTFATSWSAPFGTFNHSGLTKGINFIPRSGSIHICFGNGQSYVNATNCPVNFPSSLVTTGTWLHGAFTYDGTTISVYVNGTLIGSMNKTVNNASTTVTIGRWAATINNYYFDGKIDDVRLYNRALSSNEINQLYGLSSQALISHVKFDEGTGGNGATISDSANLNITGTIVTGASATVTHQQTVTGTATGSSSSVTSASITGASNQLYIAAIASKAHRTVSTVSGLGLTWTQVDVQCAARNATGMTVYYAVGNGTTGTVTANFSSVPIEAAITVSRYSGINLSNPIGNSISANTLGTNGGCSGGTDSTGITTTLTTGQANSMVYAAIAKRAQTTTPGASYTERADFNSGGGGDAAGITVQDRPTTTAGAYTADATASSNVDWAVVALEINAGGSSGSNWTTGKYGKAFNFDGTDDYINMGTSTALDIDSNLSVSAWIYPTQQKTATVFAHGKIPGAPYVEYQLATINTGVVRFSINTSNSLTNLDSTVLYNLNQWNYVVGVYDGTNMHVYVNGVLKSTAKSGTITETNNQSLIGGDTVFSEYFSGLIDDVKVYTQALTVTELGDLYRSNLGKAKFSVKVNDNLTNQTNSTIINKGDIAITDTTEITTINNSSTSNLSLTYPTDIGGKVWNDRNQNGIQDGAEEGVNGITVSLYNDNDSNGVPDGAAIATDISANTYQTSWEYLGTTTNLVTNPSFEINTTGLSNNNMSTMTRESTYAASGDYSVRTTKNSIAGTNEYVITNPITLSPNSAYTLSANIKKVTATGLGTFYIWWFNSSNAYISGNYINLSAGTHDWQRYSFTATSPANTSYAYIVLATDGATAGSNWDVYLDSLQLEQSSSVTAYCDGSVVAYGNQQWNGTAHASTSTCDYGNSAQVIESYEAGEYRFEDVNPANKYIIGITDPAEYNITLQYAGGQSIDNNINPSNGRSGTITVNTNEVKDNIDIGLIGNMSISGYVWEDLDNSGIRDIENATRQGMKGVKLSLYEDTDNNQQFGIQDRFIIEVQSGGNGIYNFTNLLPGKYFAVVSKSSFEEGQPLHGCVSTNSKYSGDNVINGLIDMSPGIPPDGGGLSYTTINFGFLDGKKTTSIWLNGWDYRKPIVLSGNSSTLTNHQVLITTNTKDLITSGRMRQDCRDIRITDSDQTTVLNHWLESDCNTNITRLWTKVPSIPNTPKTIYMYYGNSDAISTANGAATFEFFDDFNDNQIDGTKWQLYQGTWTETGGVLRQTGTSTQLPSKKAVMKSAPTGDNYIISAKMKADSGSHIDERFGLGLKNGLTNGLAYNYVFNNFSTKNTLRFLDDGVTWGNTTNYIWNTNQWHRMDLVISGSTISARKWRVGISAPASWENTQTWSGRSGYPTLYGGTYDGTFSFDDAYVRKYVTSDAATTVSTEQTKGAVAYLKLNENTGTTTYDTSASALNGTLTNGTAWTTGKYGSALSFDGINDYVQLGDFYSDRLTICAWIYPVSINPADSIIVKRNNISNVGHTNEWGFTLSSSGNPQWTSWDVNSSSTLNLTSSTSVALNTWSHVCAVQGGAGNPGYLYVNGVQTATSNQAGAMVNSASLMQLGSQTAGVTARYYNGKIDDVRIYNYVRSAQQIVDDMNGKNPF